MSAKSFISKPAANIFDILEDSEAEIPSVKKALKKLREIDALKSKGLSNLSSQELEKVSHEKHWKSFLPGFVQEIAREKLVFVNVPPSPKKLKRIAEKEKKEADRKRREEYEREAEKKRRKQQEEREKERQKQEEKKRHEELMKSPEYAMEFEFQEMIQKCRGNINSAFRQLSLKYHPDKNGGKDKMQKILLDLKEKIQERIEVSDFYS